MSAEEGCVLGHRRKAMECPGCAEANGSEASPAWWRWYRSRTSSKQVKAAIDARLART